MCGNLKKRLNIFFLLVVFGCSANDPEINQSTPVEEVDLSTNETFDKCSNFKANNKTDRTRPLKTNKVATKRNKLLQCGIGGLAVTSFVVGSYLMGHHKSKCKDVYVDVMSSSLEFISRIGKKSFDTELKNIGIDELARELNEGFGGIICPYPRWLGVGVKLKAEELDLLKQRMELYFKRMNIKFIRGIGGYEGGRVLNSYVVFGIKEKDIVELATNFAQLSILSFNKGKAKLLFLRGKCKNCFKVADSWNKADLECKNYTEILTPNGQPFRFTYNFNDDIFSSKNQ